jgi:hypothetical protein
MKNGFYERYSLACGRFRRRIRVIGGYRAGRQQQITELGNYRLVRGETIRHSFRGFGALGQFQQIVSNAILSRSRWIERASHDGVFLNRRDVGQAQILSDYLGICFAKGDFSSLSSGSSHTVIQAPALAYT